MLPSAWIQSYIGETILLLSLFETCATCGIFLLASDNVLVVAYSQLPCSYKMAPMPGFLAWISATALQDH